MLGEEGLKAARAGKPIINIFDSNQKFGGGLLLSRTLFSEEAAIFLSAFAASSQLYAPLSEVFATPAQLVGAAFEGLRSWLKEG